MGSPKKLFCYGGRSFSKSLLCCLLLFLFWIVPADKGFCGRKDSSEKTYSLSQLEISEGIAKRIFADFDGDGFEEFVSSDGMGALVSDFDFEVPKSACHLCGSDSISMMAALDIAGNQTPELFLGVKKEKTAWIEVYQIRADCCEVQCSLIMVTESFAGEDRNGDNIWDGNIKSCQVADLNQDGIRDILVAASSGYDMNPRAVIALDGKSGNTLWRYELAGPPYPIICRDINNDGRTEVLFGTWAPSNGCVVDDMSDSYCYLICLDDGGRLLWKNVVGGAFANVQYTLADLGNDGRFEIICTFCSGKLRDKKTHYELQIRDAIKGQVKRYIALNTSFGEPHLADLNRDNTTEIVVTNRNGNLYVFDENLEIIAKDKFGETPAKCGIAEIIDVDGEGNPDILYCSAETLMILDHNLNILSNHKTGMQIPCQNVHFFRHPIYGGLISILQGRKNGYIKASLFKMEPGRDESVSITDISGSGAAVLIFAFLAGIAVSLLALQIIPGTIKRLKRSTVRNGEERRYSLLETLSAFGHGKTATANLDRLNLLFKNIPRNHEISSGHKSKINESIRSYFELTAPRLEEIIKRSRIAEIGTGHLEDIELGREKLENMLKDYLDYGSVNTAASAKYKTVPSLIDTLEEKIEDLEDELSNYYFCQVTSTIYEVVSAMAPDLRSSNISFGNLTFSGDFSSKAFISKNDCIEVFEELIQNSIYAMANVDKRKLNISVTAGEQKISVEFSDTGCGIANENADKIFKREFSTKPEGGFGLYHVSELLSKYGATIKLTRSEPNGGTKFKIDLKKVG